MSGDGDKRFYSKNRVIVNAVFRRPEFEVFTSSFARIGKSDFQQSSNALLLREIISHTTQATAVRFLDCFILNVPCPAKSKRS